MESDPVFGLASKSAAFLPTGQLINRSTGQLTQQASFGLAIQRYGLTPC